MKRNIINNAIDYWLKTAEHDHDTMLVLFKEKRYSDSLFFGHIALEKILKAHVVKTTEKQAPYLHDLVRLKELSNSTLTNKETLFLNKVNDFNIRSRYPEYKLSFYKTCTKKYAKKYLDQITAIYEKLCRMLK